MKSLESNEQYIKKGFQDSDEESDEDGFVDEEEENPDAVFKAVKSKLMAAKNGKPMDGDDDDDDSDDPDYEEMAGEFDLYDSPMEDIDELITMKQTLDQIFQTDQNAYQYIVSKLTDEERNTFIELLGKADELKQREAACKKAFDENELAKKVKSMQ